MYESPITLYQRQIVDGVKLHIENETIKAILAYDIKVDKDELLRALSYDRGQYEKGNADGYRDGYEARDNEIVRCKDCEYRLHPTGMCMNPMAMGFDALEPTDSDFCSRGKRRGECSESES